MDGSTIALIKALGGSGSVEDLTTSGGKSDAGKVLVVGDNGKVKAVALGVGEGEVAIDESLSVSGAAADAYKTGKEISALNTSLSAVSDAITDEITASGSIVELASKPGGTVMIKTSVGESETDLQLAVCGKNMLVYPYYRADSFTSNGITYTVNSDRSITANGTAGTDSTCNVNYFAAPCYLPSLTYYLSGCTGGSAETYFLTLSSGHKQYDSEVAVPNSAAIAINVAIKVKAGVTLTNQVFRPMISLVSGATYESPGTLYTATVESGTTEHTWNNVALRDGYNLILPKNGDTVTVTYTDIIDFSNIFALAEEMGEQWKGKKWVAFGTSITDNYSSASYITQGDHAGEHTGKYVPYLLSMSGLSENTFVNRGIAGGSINGHILYYIRYYANNMADADLITIEGAVNDFAASVPLGQVGDTVPYTHSLLTDGSADGTFAGACYQTFTTALTNAPNAVVVLFTETTGKDHTGYANYNQLRTNDLGLTQYDYIDMTIKVAEFVGIPVINCGRDSMINAQNPQYIADHIHHTYLGGYQYAKTIWEKLRCIQRKALNLPT